MYRNAGTIIYMMRARLLPRLLPAVVLLSCGPNTSVDSGSRITPEYFRYATLIPAPMDGSTGGWRAVCIKARTGQQMAHPQGYRMRTRATCGLEFGGPIVNYQHGYIPLPMAQRISADTANSAAYSVLRRTRGVTARTCIQIRRETNRRIGIAINGSTVNQCGTTKSDRRVPVVHWP